VTARVLHAPPSGMSALPPLAAVCFGRFLPLCFGVFLLFLQSQPASVWFKFYEIICWQSARCPLSLENERYCQRGLSVVLVKFVFLRRQLFY
jgi:hypothetical protein